MTLERDARRVRRRSPRQRAPRLLLAAAHRRLPHQAQQPAPRPGPPPSSRSSTGWTTCSWRTRSSAPPAPRAPASPALIPRIDRVSARPLLGALRGTSTPRTRSSPRRATCASWRWSTPSRASAWRQALRETRDLIERTGWGSASRWRCGSRPPATSWLSTAYGRPTAYIACHIYRRTPNPAYFERGRGDHDAQGGRPHWGKLHTRDAAYLRGVYPRFADFTALRDRLDPDRLFGNAYLDTVLG